MDWNRFSRFVETPLRASLAILAVNAALILVSGTIFQVLGIVYTRWEIDQQFPSLFLLPFFLLLLFAVVSIRVWNRFGRLLRGRFTIMQRLAPAAAGVIPILAVTAWLIARGDEAMCGLIGAYVIGVSAPLAAFVTVMIASNSDPRFDLDARGRRSPTLSS